MVLAGRHFANGRESSPRGVAVRALLRAAVSMAMLGLAASVAVPASAQDAPGTFEGHNRIRYWQPDYALGLVSGWAYRAHVPAVSQRFTTGSQLSAYRFQGVRVAVDFIDNENGRQEIVLGLCADDNGLPGREVVRLDPVGQVRDGTVEFRARQLRGAYPVLLPNTTYHVLFTRGGGPGYRLGLRSGSLTMEGWALAGNSRSYIWRSLFNVSVGDNAIGGEYGQSRQTRGGGEEVTQEGFPVTYGWNRMSRPIGLDLVGTAITGDTPQFNLPPRPVSATVPAEGHKIDVVFDNVPADGAGQTPPAQRFTVRAAGSDVAVSGVAVSASDRRVSLTLSTTIKQGQRVRLSYTDETDGDDAAVLQSPAGVDAPPFTIYRAINNSTVTDPSPQPISATVPAAGGTIDVVFNHAPDSRAGRRPAASSFTVEADGVPVGVSGVAVSGPDKRVRLTLVTTVKQGQSVTVSYRDPTTGDDTAALQAVTGEDAASFSDYQAANGSTVANPAPKPVSATLLAAGDKIDVVFTLLLDDRTGRRPEASRFTVEADGEAVEVSGVDVVALDKRVRLTLSSALHVEQAVTVSYTDPTTGDDSAALQAPDGTDTASFSDYEVTNDSRVPPRTRGPRSCSRRIGYRLKFATRSS